MLDAPLLQDRPPDGTPPGLRFLKVLVTILTGTMIVGLVVVIALLVIRLPGGRADVFALPDRITLPQGTTALAVTRGPGWYAIVTSTNQILIYDVASGALRQTVRIEE